MPFGYKLMTFRTSHAGLLALGGQIAAAALGPVCGHPVDPTSLDMGMGFTIGMTLLDWINRHRSGQSGSTSDPLANQTG